MLAIVLLAPWVALLFRSFMGLNGLIVGAFVGLAGGLLAMVLGIVGIFRTRQFRRRGRIVAILAIPLGLVAGVFQLAVGATIYGLVSVKARGDQAIELLRCPRDETAQRAAQWHTDVASARFQASVTPENLAGWLTEVIDQYGQLQVATPLPKNTFGSERGVTVYRLNGQFVNGSAPIELVIGFDRRTETRIDDVRVKGSSPRAWSPKTP